MHERKVEIMTKKIKPKKTKKDLIEETNEKQKKNRYTIKEYYVDKREIESRYYI